MQNVLECMCLWRVWVGVGRESWGDPQCQVSGLIMALPVQLGRLFGWELHKPHRGQETTKLACHTQPLPTCTHTCGCLLATQLNTYMPGRKGKEQIQSQVINLEK